MEIAAYVVIALALFVYSILLSIECGGAVLLLRDDPRRRKLILAYLGPVWETTNVFLVFAIVAAFAFFPGATAAWGTALITPFFVFLVIMGVRALGMLLVFYDKAKSRAAVWVFGVASALAPAVLVAGAVPYLMTGNDPFALSNAPFAAELASVTFGMMMLIAWSFFAWIAERGTSASGRNLIRFGIVKLVAAVSFVTVALFQFPYIVYPKVTVYNAFTGPATAQILFWCFGIGAALVLPALGILYYLFMFSKRKDTAY